MEQQKKQDSDSGVGSDNGDKRLSATEVCDAFVSPWFHPHICLDSCFNQASPAAHAGDLATFRILQLFMFSGWMTSVLGKY